MADEVPLSGAQLLARRLLVNRVVTEPYPRKQPVVVLLGPAGSGKTEALHKISRDCRDDVVHTMFDFAVEPGRTQPVTTVEALTGIARGFARDWTNRRSVRFTRFALGLVAVQADLNLTHRHLARDDLRSAIKDWSRIRRAEQAANGLGTMAEDAGTMNIAPAPVLSALRLALPELIKTVARKPLGKARRWHADIPEARGASAEDALIRLNDSARDDPATMTSWLTQAFLADIRDSHPRMAATEPGSRCGCDERDEHYHNWLLLLDNLDHEGGAQFVTDLSDARRRHLEHHHEDHDALLVLASSGRWNTDWESDWRAPWRSAPLKRDGLAPVPRCDTASHLQWAGRQNADQTPPTYYPVLLPALTGRETARVLGVKTTDLRCELTQKATGGLAMAVHTLMPLLAGNEPTPGSRNLLGPVPAGTDPADEPQETALWRERLVKLRLDQHLGDVGIEDLVSAAPFATAPWLVPHSSPSLISAPQIGRILTELRSALWVTAPARGGATANYAELHPWVAQTLVSALLARESKGDQPSYRDRFDSLLGDQGHDDDRVRTMYCRLARGETSAVTTFFTACFDEVPHQEWISRLRLVTGAPSDKPLERPVPALFTELVEADVATCPQRSDLRNIVIRLVGALWLAKNPFVVPDPVQRRAIADNYRSLPPKSRRADVDALNVAATAAERGRL